MTKLKQTVPYLLLVVISYFVAKFILENFLDSGLIFNVYSIESMISNTIILSFAYIPYAIINKILKKTLPVHAYKENKIVQFITFFLIYTIDLTIAPIVVLLLMAIIFGGI